MQMPLDIGNFAKKPELNRKILDADICTLSRPQYLKTVHKTALPIPF